VSPSRRRRPRSPRRPRRAGASPHDMSSERRPRRPEPEQEPGLFDAPEHEPQPAPAPPPPPPPPPPPAGDAAPPPEPRAAAAEPQLYSVSALTALLNQRLGELGRIRVEGEVAQKRRMASGHVYFDLKDAGAKLACKLWQSQAARILRFELADGAQVIPWGRLDV